MAICERCEKEVYVTTDGKCVDCADVEIQESRDLEKLELIFEEVPELENYYIFFMGAGLHVRVSDRENDIYLHASFGDFCEVHMSCSYSRITGKINLITNDCILKNVQVWGDRD